MGWRSIRARRTQQLSLTSLAYTRSAAFYSSSANPPPSYLFRVSEEVRDAVASKRPVVALESTLYTHGLPHPENGRLAKKLESLTRDHGAVPATIGVLDGVPIVGMSHEEILELLDAARRQEAAKVSRRDLAHVCSPAVHGKPLSGGTTVSGTSVLAHLAGISIFGTGGLGGVHKGGERSLDISADLVELGRTPIAVISSGCKSFLDIPRTLEYLETQGVSVATFADRASGGPVNFPAFWSRDSGVRSPLTVRSDEEAAAMIFAMRRLPLQSGMLLANPIPEQFAIPKANLDRFIAQAVAEAKSQGIAGGANTPFVLSRILELSRGATLEANVHLVESNVVRAAKVAGELSKLETGSTASGARIWSPHPSPALERHDHKSRGASLLVAGSVAVDLSCNYRPSVPDHRRPSLGTSNPVSILESVGGVGQNIAMAAQLCGADAHFCSAVGNDEAGRSVSGDLRHRGLSTSGIVTIPEYPTARYIALNNVDNTLEVAMADMEIFEGKSLNIEKRWVQALETMQPAWVALDGNWSPRLLRLWIDHARKYAKIAFEPVSAEKAIRLFASELEARDQKGRGGLRGAQNYHDRPLVDLATPNILELKTMAAHTTAIGWRDSIREQVTHITEQIQRNEQQPLGLLGSDTLLAALSLLPKVPCLLVKGGPEGVLLVEVLGRKDEHLEDPIEKSNVYFRPTDRRMGGPQPDCIPWCDDFGGVHIRHFPPPTSLSASEVVSTNGSGDTFLGVLLAGLVSQPSRRIGELVQIAQEGAALTLRSRESVSPRVKELAPKIISPERRRLQ